MVLQWLPLSFLFHDVMKKPNGPFLTLSCAIPFPPAVL